MASNPGIGRTWSGMDVAAARGSSREVLTCILEMATSHTTTHPTAGEYNRVCATSGVRLTPAPNAPVRLVLSIRKPSVAMARADAELVP
jgi:hypothetical protein